MGDTIKINVSGQVYEILTEVIENGPISRLTMMYKTGSNCIMVNRPAESFAAILAMYQTGELHIPMTSCPGAFLSELEFWDISPDMISDCCYNRLQSFLDEQATLRQFKEDIENEIAAAEFSPSASCHCYQRLRGNVWKIVDYTKPSLMGKVYFAVTLLMVLLSIFTLGYSTDPSFQRAMTNCERLDYMITSGMEDYDLVQKQFKEFCEDEYLPNKSVDYTEGQEDNDYFMYYTVSSVNDDPTSANSDYDDNPENGDNSEYDNDYTSPHGNDTRSGNRTGNNSVSMSRGVQMDYIPNVFLSYKSVKIPNMKMKIFVLVILEGGTTVFFTADIILRLASCPRLNHYFLSAINTADAIALLAAYLHMCVPLMYKHLRYGNIWIDRLAYVQMLRSLRLFRIVANVRAGKVLAYSARRNIKDLSILVLFLVAGMCTFASCLYIAEEKNTVESIPVAWYWAIITMTTVGYGDIEPHSGVGRLLACLCAVVGVLLLALTVPIFANHFLILYQHVDSKDAVAKFENRKLNTIGLGFKKKTGAFTDNKDNTVTGINVSIAKT